VERQTALALAAAARLAREPGLEVAARPESSIVCFRVEGSDDRQLAVRRRLLAGERHYVSSAVFRGRRWLRLALMSPATDEAELERLVAAVREAAAAP
jgi:L-2,4-diaminobutyrate decarboxylase